MVTQKEVYDRSKFTVIPSRGAYTVYYDNSFFETADSLLEAEKDIEEITNKSA